MPYPAGEPSDLHARLNVLDCLHELQDAGSGTCQRPGAYRRRESLPASAHALLTILTTDAPDTPPPADGSLAERVADLAGIGRGEHSDLSTNHTHLDDFGR